MNKVDEAFEGYKAITEKDIEEVKAMFDKYDKERLSASYYETGMTEYMRTKGMTIVHPNKFILYIDPQA